MAAELQRKDLIDDDALMAPLVLSKNLQDAVKSLQELKRASGEYNSELQKSKSPKKASDEIGNLNKVQAEQAKIIANIAAVVAKTNTEYIAQEIALRKVKEELKQKIALGDREATTITKQNASLAQLGAALDANRKAYAQLRSEEERNSKSGQELLKIIQQQDSEFKELRKSVGQNQDNVGNYEGAVKSLKAELKAARDEMAGIAATLGTDSKEFQQAAEKAGALKDEIGDLQDAVKDVSGSKLENLSSTFGSVFGKLKGGDFQGALESARQFATVSKSISFAEAGKSISQFGQTIGVVGKAILTNPIFILAAVITGIVVAVIQLRDKIKPLATAFDFFGGVIDYSIDKLKEFSDWLGISSFKSDESSQKIIENAKKQQEAYTQLFDDQIKLAEAAGKETQELEKSKYITAKFYAEKQIRELEAIKKRGTKLDEEQEKDLEAQYKARHDAIINLEALDIKIKKDQKDRAEEAAKKEIERIQKIKDRQDELNRKRDEGLELIRLQEYNEKLKQNELATKGIADAVRKLEDVYNGVVDQILIDIDTVVEGEEALTQRELDEIKKRVELRKQASQEIANIEKQRALLILDLSSNLTSSLTELENNRRDEQISILQDQLDEEVKLAGDNQEAKVAIQKKYNAEIDQIKKEQATAQKRQALFEKLLAIAGIIINTNAAAAAALAPPPIGLGPVIGVPVATGIKINGAIQVASVLATAIPQFEKGTESAPGGLAIVAEKGTELLLSPSGDLSLTPSQSSLINLEKGTKVFTHEETTRILAYNGIKKGMIEASENGSYDFRRLEDRLDSLERTIKNKKENHINVTRAGLETMMKQAETRQYFLNNIYG